MKYPIGPKTRQAAANTDAGKLANLLDRVLYSADTTEIINPKMMDKPMKRWVAEDRVFKSNDPLPSGMKHDESDNHFETKHLMLAIRDYLEFTALKEVIP